MAAGERSEFWDHNTSDAINNVTQHAILHACLALSPVGIKLPVSGTYRIDQFCTEIVTLAQEHAKSKKKKKKKQLIELSLVPEVEILKFYEGASSASEFAEIICSYLSQYVGEDFNETEEKIQKLCWKKYSECQKFNVTYPKWLTGDSTYSLWLVFCCSLSSLSEKIEPNNVQEIFSRIYTLCSYSWDINNPIPAEPIDFPNFLERLTLCFSALDIHPTVVTDATLDLKDEMVYGVLRKGYLLKKGHKAPTIKRRWFVLMRDALIYYKSRDNMIEKGKIVLNPSTSSVEIPDKNERKHRFKLVCGKSKVEYEIYADDNRSRNAWILDIQKAIQLKNALNQNNIEDFDQALGHFYRLRYGTSFPALDRADSLLERSMKSASTILQMTMKRHNDSIILATSSPVVKHRFYSLDGGACQSYKVGSGKSASIDLPSSHISDTEDTSEKLYEIMDGLKDEDSDENGNGYTYMFKGKDHDIKEQIDTCDEEKSALKKNDNEGFVLTSENTDLSLKIVSNESNQHTPDHSDGMSNCITNYTELSENDSLYVRLSETDPEAIQQKPMKKADRSRTDLMKQDSPPCPPPRPSHTMASNKSFEDVSFANNSSTPMGSNNTRPPSVYSPPYGSIRTSLSSPIPPPRPLETLTSSSTFYSKSVCKTNIREFDFSTEDMEHSRSLLTPPPIPARTDHPMLEGKSSISSTGSPTRIRHPPYSNESNEQELYYVVPNAKSPMR